MDCFFPHEPVKLIFEPCWIGLKLVPVWEAEKKHPSIRKHVGRQVKGVKGGKGWKVREAPRRRYAEGCCWIGAAFEGFGFGFAVAARQPCGHALSCKTTRELWQVVHHNNLVWHHPGAVNDYDHCGVFSFLASHKPRGKIWSQVSLLPCLLCFEGFQSSCRPGFMQK